MKRLTVKTQSLVFITIISVLALTLLGCNDKPLTDEEVRASLKADQAVLGDAGFTVNVTNTSDSKFEAKVRLVPTVVQNGVNVKEGFLETTETWEPHEAKKIFVKYTVNKPMSGANYEVQSLFSVLTK